jgi:polysaccharide pyruvyl transferase WcaK-like protein
MKISLLGQFGSGNSGNDGSLEAMLNYLHKACPDAELLCICSNPQLIGARYGIAAVGVGGPPLSKGWQKLINKALLRVPRRLALFYFALAQFGSMDLMIIPGTGILDDFQESAFGWPLVIFFWCLAARLRRTSIAFISIGAGPIRGRLSRWLLGSAVKMASYRSYRDDYSLDYVRSLGQDVSLDYRYPDIAFSLAAPVTHMNRDPGTITVGLGIMTYRGWQKGDPRAAAIYDTYINKMSTLVSWLVANGFRLRLFMGDRTDEDARDDVLAAAMETIVPERRSYVETGSCTSLHDIMEQMSSIDVAIVSRYHNLVCALKLSCPVISLGYAQKNDDLMAQFDQQAYCRHIETFEVEDLKLLLQQLISNRGNAASEIEAGLRRAESDLGKQEDLLKQKLLGSPSVSRRRRGAASFADAVKRDAALLDAPHSPAVREG